MARRAYKLPAFAVIVTALAVAGCSSPANDDKTQTTADYRVYPTVSSLAESAEVVVLGSVEEVVSREIDGDPSEEEFDAEGNPNGTPMVFFRYSVKRVIKGSVAADHLILGWIDTDKVSMEGVSRIQRGEPTLLFLRRLSDVQSPGITSVDQFYIPVSGDNGVFDVVGSAVRARSRLVEGMAQEGQTENARPLFEAPLKDVAAVASRSGAA